jgi:hypothetical protein
MGKLHLGGLSLISSFVSPDGDGGDKGLMGRYASFDLTSSDIEYIEVLHLQELETCEITSVCSDRFFSS